MTFIHISSWCGRSPFHSVSNFHLLLNHVSESLGVTVPCMMHQSPPTEFDKTVHKMQHIEKMLSAFWRRIHYFFSFHITCFIFKNKLSAGQITIVKFPNSRERLVWIHANINFSQELAVSLVFDRFFPYRSIQMAISL